MKRSMQLGISNLLKQTLCFTMFAALCFSRKLNKVSLEYSALELPPLGINHMWNGKCQTNF